MIAALLLGGIYGVNYLIPQEGIMAQTMTAQAADGKLQISTGSGTTESGNNLSDTATKTPSDTSRKAYNLDGGHCSFMTLQNQVANNPYKPEHRIEDGIFITEGL